MSCYQVAKDFSPAVITFVIGLIASYIAFNQYKVAHAKLKLDLFEKRYAIFEETWKFLSGVIQGDNASDPPIHPIMNLAPQASFLFGKDIEEYISLAHSNRIELARTERQIQPSNSEAIDRNAHLMNWFYNEASSGVKAVFSPYLDFDKWR